MRRVRDELRSQALLLLQARGHLIERPGERGDLERPVGRDANVPLTPRDAVRGRTDASQRRREPAREKDRERDAPKHARCGRQDEEPGDALVEHRPCVGHRISVVDHELLERPGGEAEDAHDDHRHGRCGHRDRRKRDPYGHAPHAGVTARYPTPRTVAT